MSEYQDPRLTPDERADLAAAYRQGLHAVEDIADELAAAYYAAGLVAGDLGHDGTIRAEAAAE